jgi:hypothetical protein
VVLFACEQIPAMGAATYCLGTEQHKNLNIFEFCPIQAKGQKSEQEPHQHENNTDNIV